MIIEAGPFLADISRKDLFAALQRENVVDRIKHFKAVGTHVRSVVFRAVFTRFRIRSESFEDSGVCFVQGNTDIRISLVVTEQDIVFRLISLDEIVFEEQSLRFGTYDCIFKVGNMGYHRPDLGAGDNTASEIALQSVP